MPVHDIRVARSAFVNLLRVSHAQMNGLARSLSADVVERDGSLIHKCVVFWTDLNKGLNYAVEAPKNFKMLLMSPVVPTAALIRMIDTL